MFEVYKKGQGSTARWIAACGLGGMALFGCYELQEALGARIETSVDIGVATVGVSVLISAGVFLAAAVLIGMLVNSKRLVDYLISGEVELRKVSWPTRDELKRQTTVVIITLIFFGVILLVADIAFLYGSRFLYGF